MTELIKIRNGQSSSDTGDYLRLLLVHGGPGLDSSYFRKPFSEMPLSAEIYTYNQSGDEEHTPTIAELVDQLSDAVAQLVEQDKRRAVVLAHSWGTYLALQLFSDPEMVDTVSGLVLSNPLPREWAVLVEGMGVLGSRLDADRMAKIDTLETEGSRESGRKALELAISAYLSPRNTSPYPTFETYIPSVNAAVVNQIEGYEIDIDKIKIPRPSLILYGEDDFLPVNGLGDMPEGVATKVLRSAGHFPFCEDPAAFAAAVEAYLQKISFED